MADSKEYQFFQNRQCEYFPCHEVEKEEDFNCLFCYCPLYQKERCLGHPSLLLNEKGQKIKDCSKCELVHRREMYDAVIRALAERDEVVTLNVGTLRERIWERMAQIASWDRMDQEMYRTHKAKAVGSIAARMEEAKHLYRVSILLQPFSGQCVKKGYFQIGEEKIRCQVLEKLDLDQIQQGYFYTFHAPEFPVKKTDDLLQQYYFEVYQIACLDVVREWIREYLARKHSVRETRYASPSFGPGFYGMELEATEKILSLMNPEKAGVSWQEGSMHPLMSLAGMYLISKKDVLPSCRDCASCIGRKEGCQYCSNNR